MMFKRRFIKKLQNDFQTLLDLAYDAVPEHYEELVDLMNDHDALATRDVLTKIQYDWFRTLDTLQEASAQADGIAEIEAFEEIVHMSSQPRLAFCVKWGKATLRYESSYRVSEYLKDHNITFTKRT